MTDPDPDSDLPLHDEAKAREKWRGGETVVRKGSDSEAGPASEIDDASQDQPSGPAGPDAGLGIRPPD